MQDLREAWGAQFGIDLKSRMLEIGAFFLRTETELILKSRRVVPGKLQNAGFVFQFPTWRAAANDLVSRWRAKRRRSE
jgi:NAD dependent epimerase/dehydratase family enzyme